MPRTPTHPPVCSASCTAFPTILATALPPNPRLFPYGIASKLPPPPKPLQSDRAIILTTHSMEEAEILCDRLGIFVDGQLVCIGNPREITSRYAGAGGRAGCGGLWRAGGPGAVR